MWKYNNVLILCAIKGWFCVFGKSGGKQDSEVKQFENNDLMICGNV